MFFQFLNYYENYYDYYLFHYNIIIHSYIILYIVYIYINTHMWKISSPDFTWLFPPLLKPNYTLAIREILLKKQLNYIMKLSSLVMSDKLSKFQLSASEPLAAETATDDVSDVNTWKLKHTPQRYSLYMA